MKKDVKKLYSRLLRAPLLQYASTYKLFSLAILTLLLAAGFWLAGLGHISNWLLISISAAVSLPLAYGMVRDIRDGIYGVDILALTAIITSLLLKEYWTAAIIVLMLTGGEALEDYAERRSKRELDDLLKRAPTTAHVFRGRKVVDVNVDAVREGDRVLVKPGEVTPVDAIIIEGAADFDESSLTGESLPQSKKLGDQILSGTISIDGAVTVRATHSAADSQYEQIIRLVRQAAASKAPFVRLADRYSIPFTIVAFAIAGIAWYLSGDAIRFLQVIVVATPCPLILAAPIAIISGMSRASKHGVIVRTGSALERLARIRTLAFDKTGTLTTGQPVVDDITTFGKFTKNEILSFAAALESASTHVLAHTINEAALKAGASVPKPRQLREFSGMGLSATVRGRRILVGRKDLLDDNNVTYPPRFRADHIKQTVTFVAVDGVLAGTVTFRDAIRPETPATLSRLQQLGISDFEMVTGDSKAVAAEVASQLGITQVISEALPGEKMLALENIRKRPVGFVGDGVNDAPVLMAADVGIALGARGSTAASESADIVIMVDDIGRVATAFGIAKRTFRIARQSILIGIGLSVALMAVFATGKFPPIYGALLQEVVDVIVIFNALRAHVDK